MNPGLPHAPMVPVALRRWFITHFAVDWLVGIPLFVAPEPLLRLFGWHQIDPIATRLDLTPENWST